MQVIQQKVMQGGTLNDMKKEISMLAEAIDLEDPLWSDLSLAVSNRRSRLMKKNPQEMHCIL